jgi:protein-S-isoprenylcysteine O-methyltransferase Ste14
MWDFQEKPNRIPWPPLLYAGMAAVAVAAHLVWPLPWPQPPWSLALRLTGLALVTLAAVIEISAFRTFRQHQTTILPTRGATKLITSGPFRLSRNPVYLGNTFAVFGAGLLLGVIWLLPAALIAAGFTQKLAIAREERHLAARFGAEWQTYAVHTPRWLWFI